MPGLQYPPWGQCSQRGRGRLPAPEGRPCTENWEGPHGRPPRWPAGAGPGTAEPNEKLDRAVRAVHIRGQRGRRPAPRVRDRVPRAQGWGPCIQDDRGLERREERYSGRETPTEVKARRQEGAGDARVLEAG